MARILIIDDDEVFLSAVGQLLAAAGHAVVTANDGLKGEKLFSAEPFEVILTDIVMPNREGLETIIRLHRDFPEVGVIAMSGGVASSRTYLELAGRLGAHRVLSKPFSSDELLATIAEVIRIVDRPAPRPNPAAGI
jgi:DNA-binding response OmpR family regulator